MPLRTCATYMTAPMSTSKSSPLSVITLDAIVLTQLGGLVCPVEQLEGIGGHAGGVSGPGMVGAASSHTRREGCLGERQSFSRALRVEQQARIIAAIAICE